MHQIALILKPGGLIDLTEFDFRVYGLDHQPIPITMEAPALVRWVHLAHRAVQMQGGEPDAANHLYRWIYNHGTFEDVHYREWWIQTSTWNTGQDEESSHQNRYGAAMRDDILVRVKVRLPLLVSLTDVACRPS